LSEDSIIQIFDLVDDTMKTHSKHAQAKLYPSELVTIGILFILNGGHSRAFYRFAGLPDQNLPREKEHPA